MTDPATDAARLGEVLAALVPLGVTSGCIAIGPDDVDGRGLLPDEAEAVAAAVASRRAEMAAGRRLLRSLLGIDAPIPVAPSGAPQLPVGRVGSLAHDRALAVAVVADASAFAAVGVDVEPLTDLTDDEAAVVRRPDEDGLDPLLCFVAKEAAYKAWAGTGGDMLEFHEVRLVDDGENLTAHVQRGDGLALPVRVAEAASRLVAVAAVPAAVSRAPA